MLIRKHKTELCVDCEANEPVHNHSHLLVKLRVPLEALSLKNQMLFKNHIVDPTERAIAKQEKRVLREKHSEFMAKKKEDRNRDKKLRAKEKIKRLQAIKAKTAEKSRHAMVIYNCPMI